MSLKGSITQKQQLQGSAKPSDGFSPTIDVAEVENGHELIVKDKTGEKRFVVQNGKDGAKGEQGEISLDYASRNFSTAIVKDASGETITTTDSANVPPLNIIPYGKSTQKTYEGNQLFDIDSGIENEYFFPSPDTQTQSPNIKVLYISVEPSTKYYVSSIVGSGSMRIAELTSDKVFVNRTTLSEGQEKCIETKENVAYFQIAYENTFTKCMINKGATALPYEPYVGGEASPNINYPQEVVPHGKGGSIVQKLLSANLLNPNACDRNFPFGIPNDTTFLWVKTDVDLVQGKTYYTGFSINGVYGHYSHYINYDIESSSQGLVTKVTNGVFVAQRSGKLCFRTDASSGATIDNLFVSEVYVEEFEPYTEQPMSYQTPNGLHGIPLGATIPDVIKNSPIHMRGVYHDGEQYWIADTRNENGKDVQRTLEVNLSDLTWMDDWNSIYTFDGTYLVRANVNNTLLKNNNVFLTHFSNNETLLQNSKIGFDCRQGNGKSLGIRVPTSIASNLTEWNAWCETSGAKYVYILAEPIVTDTSAEELAQFNALRMNYPNTTIVNDANAYTEVEYVADTKCYIDNKIEKKFNELAVALVSQ